MNKTVVVTGGATGIGAAAVTRLLEKSCELHILDVVAPAQANTRFIRCDLSDPNSINAAIAQLPSAVDALVNVAGIAKARIPATVVAVNFLGLRHLTELLAPRIVAGGSIVNVASSAGRDWQKRSELVRDFLDTETFQAGLAWLNANENDWIENPYKFSKQCAAAYTYRAARLAARLGIRVNCVNPGAVETQLTPAFRKIVGTELYDWGIAQIGRHGTPEEIADVIEFLAIGACQRLNGVEIVVDGGYTAGVIDGWIKPPAAPPAPATPHESRNK